MCCQLGAEFTLLEKLAAGSNFFFFFCVDEFRKQIGSDRLPCPRCTRERYYFGKSSELQNNIYAKAIVTDGVKNVRCGCTLQRLRSVFYPVFSINKS